MDQIQKILKRIEGITFISNSRQNIVNFFEKNTNKMTWTKDNHKFASLNNKDIIKTILILNLKNKETCDPNFSEGLIYTLPKEIVLEIFKYLPLFDTQREKKIIKKKITKKTTKK